MPFLSRLVWRSSIETFDPAKKITPRQLNAVLKAVQYAPSSYGLQPYHVYVVSDPDVRKKMKSVCFGQPQAVDAPYTFVFCARNDVVDRIGGYIDLSLKKASLLGKAKLKRYKGSMLKTVGKMDGDRAFAWASKQTYIALGFALAACAELGIDSCPMEGFSSAKMSELLDVPSYLKPVVLLSLGKRKGRPAHRKIRFSQKDLFTEV